MIQPSHECPLCGSNEFFMTTGETDPKKKYVCSDCCRYFDEPTVRSPGQDQQTGILTIWLGERDRLIGKLESLLSMADKYVPNESPALKDAIANALREVEEMYNGDD